MKFKKIKFKYHKIKGIGLEPGIARRDPSCIIKYHNKYYVWYTKVYSDTEFYPGGYSGTVWCATSEGNKYSWEEQGEAIPVSEGRFDSRATFTPNIFVFNNKFYMTYTAVTKGFSKPNKDKYSEINRTYIGMALADTPEGPWKKIDNNPILESTGDPEKFDSFRIDDSCFIVKNNTIYFYYKGRQWENTAHHTKMGLAASNTPEGPFIRQNNGNFVQDSGHEVCVWPYKEGVMSLVSNTGPNGRTLQYSRDGISFEVVGELPKNYPAAPSFFRQDFSQQPEFNDMVKWGICHTGKPDPHLEYFEMIIR